MDDDLRAQVDELRRLVADQRIRLDRSTRRDLLRLTGAALAGAAGAAAAGSGGAAATTGDPLIAGATEDAETQTTLVYDGPPLASGGVFVAGTGAPPASADTAGVVGYSDGAALWGVHGTSPNAGGGGVVGTSAGAGAGVVGRSTSGPDLVAGGTGFLRLGPAGHSIPSITPVAGDLFRMDDGGLLYTTATGPPAQIIDLVGNVGGLVLLDVPVRVVDTRLGGGGKLQPGTVRTFSFQVGVDGEGAVPEGSRAAVFTVTVDATEGAGGFLTIYAADESRPLISSVNWFGPNQILANTTISRVVRPSGEVRVYTGVNRTHMIVDVIGYHR